MSDIVSKRILTRKSIIGFGNHKLLSVQQVIDLQRSVDLVKMYYGLGKIDFIPEILDEIGIKEEMRIPKPSSGRDFHLLEKYLPEICSFYRTTMDEKQKGMQKKLENASISDYKKNVEYKERFDLSKGANMRRNRKSWS